jgi:hypothetical protein
MKYPLSYNSVDLDAKAGEGWALYAVSRFCSDLQRLLHSSDHSNRWDPGSSTRAVR